MQFVIRDALIYDGSGQPPAMGDVAVEDGRIVGVGVVAASSGLEIDARGRALAPGFIDAHTHDDRAVLSDPGQACKITQGVTTVVTGNCGLSIAPYTKPGRPPAPLDLIGQDGSDFFATFADYAAALKRQPPAVNVLAQIGHSTLRLMTMDDVTRPASDDEIRAMKRLLRQAMEEGAAGLSTGLEYPLSEAAPTEEVVHLCEVVHEYGGFHSTHMRDEGANVLDSIDETARIGRAGAVPVVISHHKLSGTQFHGRSVETLRAIEDIARGQALGLDAYPYAASSTMLSAVRVGRSSKTVIAWSVPHPDCTGRAFEDIRLEWNCSVDEAVERLSPAGAIYFAMDEADVARILGYPRTMIGSDGLPHDIHPHPRLWGTFARVLGYYGREHGLFTLEEAVRKMTALPAATFGIKDRGRIQPGYHADLVLFDPEKVIDRATFDDPRQPAAGIEAVWVNGVVAMRRGQLTGLRTGRLIGREDRIALRQDPWSMVLDEEPAGFSLSQ